MRKAVIVEHPEAHWLAQAEYQHAPLKIDASGTQNLVDQCPQRLREAIKSAYPHIEHREHGRIITPGVMSEEQWKAFKKTERECAQ